MYPVKIGKFICVLLHVDWNGQVNFDLLILLIVLSGKEMMGNFSNVDTNKVTFLFVGEDELELLKFFSQPAPFYFLGATDVLLNFFYIGITGRGSQGKSS